MKKLVKLMWDTRLPTYINCIRLGGVTECSWPSGAVAESDTLDTVCDRGSLTNQTITTTGSIRAGGGKITLQSDGSIIANNNLSVKGSATVNNTMTVKGNLVADGNTWGGYKSKTDFTSGAGAVDCPDGYYMTGIIRIGDLNVSGVRCHRL